MAKRHLVCIGCNEKLKIFEKTDTDILLKGGNYWLLDGQYGSKFDTDKISICLCDECIEDMGVPVEKTT